MESESYIVIAAACLLAAAAWFFSTENACASESTGSTGVSGNGFAVNNPGNLRYIAPPDNFNGQTGQTAQGIGIYDSLSDGLRAMYLQLQEYFSAGDTTITEIVTRWAPPTENCTSNYIDAVAEQTSIPACQNLDWSQDALPVMYAMIVQENGQSTVDANNFTPAELQTLLQNAGVLT